ncbi:hypothetical protein COO60DRAFT_1699425 [Scenedesmus sp. NREL 46B-D3]|nr:hypothetical protein COO60DRAFT_1699425 [Scenedesmus sp. NREL 46B-D3]
MNQAGIPLKAAMGDRWLGAKERTAAGKPPLGTLLSEDPYFILKDYGGSHLHVQLRISRLAQLSGNAELISQYKSSAGSSGPGGSSSTAHGAGSSSAAAAGGRQGRLQLNSEGLPMRPGVGNCQHFMKHGWCLFKQECWYNHPERPGKRKAPPQPGGGGAPAALSESHLEPGVMLRGGVHPVRPGARACPHYMRQGWCPFKARCRNDHPDLQDAASSSGSSSSRMSPVSPLPDGPHEALVRQPAQQLLLGLLIDSLWPPRASKDNYVKGQSLHDPSERPYSSLNALLEQDAYFTVWIAGGGTPMVTLLFGRLVDDGGDAAAERLSAMADAVWPPTASKEAWLRGSLAKWLMDAGFKGRDEARKVLPRVMALGPEQPTVFRMDMAQAGEFLLRSWKTAPHPYDPNSQPWTQLKPLIAAGPALLAPMHPGPPYTPMGATWRRLDLAARGRGAKAVGVAARGVMPITTTEAAGSQLPGLQRSGGYGATPAAGLPAGEGVIDVEDDDVDDDDILELSLLGAAAWAAATRQPGAAAASSSSNSNLQPQQQQQQQQQRPSNGASSSGGRGVSGSGGGPADVASAEADLTALESLNYEPPDNMQWWWPEHKPEKQECSWTEIAIRLLDPAAEEFELQLAEMVQHLEISSMVGMACATYKSHPHLLQFFAPHAAIGGLELPSAVYLLDVMRPGRRIAEVLALVRPVLASAQHTKVCHGSKLWSGQLEKVFNIRLVNYYDTQQANYVWNVSGLRCLRYECGRAPHLSRPSLKGTAEVSLSTLLRSYDLYHPVRHNEAHKEAVKLWQDRPLSEELVTCAAADVAYLVPLMELQLRQLRQAAAEVRLQQQQQRPGSRAAALLSSLPEELSDPETLAAIAAGAEVARGGGFSYERVRALGGLAAFHQVALHDVMGLRPGQTYGAIRGRPH